MCKTCIWRNLHTTAKVLWCCWVTCSMRKWNMEHLDCNCLSFVLVRRRIKNQESSCNSRFARFLIVGTGSGVMCFIGSASHEDMGQERVTRTSNCTAVSTRGSRTSANQNECQWNMKLLRPRHETQSRHSLLLHHSQFILLEGLI